MSYSDSFVNGNGMLYIIRAIKSWLLGKVDKVEGKSLSANDYTDAEKNKLAGIAAGANAYTHPTTSGNKHVPSGGGSGKILRWSADGTAVWGDDSDTTYGPMTGATSGAAGASGLVPAPAVGKHTSFLRGDGTWVVPTNTTYNVATPSANGLMSKEDKAKLNGVEAGANAYSHPAHTAKTSGLYKVTVDSEGHVSAAEGVVKADITALGIPGTNTTYSPATASANGLMSSSDKSKLDAFGVASTYALKSDITGMYKFLGSKATASALPATGNTVGDVWNVTASGMNYAWDGTAWDALGEVFTITALTNAEIDAILAM